MSNFIGCTLALAILFIAIATREEMNMEAQQSKAKIDTSAQRIVSLEASVVKLKGRVSKANYALNFFMAGEWNWDRCIDRIPETRLADGSWLTTLNVVDCEETK